nr:Stp1/IreP family PP2C-type Ser/Thr phosphatase [Tissierella sp.]
MEKISLSDIGNVREKNQDSFLDLTEYNIPLFVIADGMGGHKSGEVASSDAVKIIKEVFLENKEGLNDKKIIKSIIEESIKKSNEIIYKESLESPECSGMGTTISLCYIYENCILIGHVGDSRIYLIQDKEIFQLTEDHSLVYELVKKGEITLDEAKHHPKRNMITRAVGTSSSIEVDILDKKYREGDKLILCTDGLFNMVDEIEILNTINEGSSIFESGEMLINKAKLNGGLDNISLILVKF